jgi:GNAT superfamily N-acetyltransferase
MKNNMEVKLKDGNTYLIKALTTETVDSLTLLFNTTKKNKETSEYFSKKYLFNYLKLSFKNYLLFDGEIAIGFSGVTFNQLKNHQKEIVVGQLGDVLVHPHYRGLGIQSVLLKLAADTCKANKIDGLLALPNSQAEPIFANNSDWTIFTSFYNYTFPVKTFPLLKLLNKLNISTFFMAFFQFINRINFSKLKFWKSNLYTYELYYPIRSEAFFDYKKYKKYTISESQGVKFIWSLDDGIVVGDWEISENVNTTDVINKIKLFAKWRGIHSLRFVTTKNNYWYDELCKVQEPVKSLNIYFRSFNSEVNLHHLCFNSFDRNAY